MNTYAPSGCTFVYGREGELLACLGPEERPRALLAGVPPTQRGLTEAEVEWLGRWVPQGEVQHLDKSYGYGFRCASTSQLGAPDMTRKAKSELFSAFFKLHHLAN